MFTKPEMLSPESFELADLFFLLSRWKTRKKSTPFLRLARGLNINTTQHKRETNAYYVEL